MGLVIKDYLGVEPLMFGGLGKDAPKKLWYRGVWREEIFESCAAVVGSRAMTEYGRRVIEKLVPELVEDGYTIVSGFMYGVDQTAHEVCVECGGKTIAVLGWGIDWKMEDRDLKLADRIVDSGGLVISEWEEQPGALWTFPVRNRIVAALVSKIFVVEAAVRSGSMITVEWGRKLGREIWAVPGPITSRVSEGTNRLIADGVAKIWLPNIGDRVSVTNKMEVYIALQNESLSVDELVRKMGRSAEDIGSELTMMMLSGEIAERGGKYYLVST